jgi:hypothetical protein
VGGEHYQTESNKDKFREPMDCRNEEKKNQQDCEKPERSREIGGSVKVNPTGFLHGQLIEQVLHCRALVDKLTEGVDTDLQVEINETCRHHLIASFCLHAVWDHRLIGYH